MLLRSLFTIFMVICRRGGWNSHKRRTNSYVF